MSRPKKVFKYSLPVEDGPHTLTVPEYCAPVHVAMQHNRITIWAEVFPDNPMVERVFFVHGTGHSINADHDHVGTVLDGSFVWHVYEADS